MECNLDLNLNLKSEAVPAEETTIAQQTMDDASFFDSYNIEIPESMLEGIDFLT